MAERFFEQSTGARVEDVAVTAPQGGHAALASSLATPVASIHSYVDTPWALVNSLLALVDAYSGGKAGVLQRLFSYLFIGGFAAVVNLSIYTFLAGVEHAPFWVAQLVAAEISIFANFIPNDRITFRHLAGHQRSWLARCSRFHITSIGGTFVTIVVSWLTQQYIYSRVFSHPAQGGLVHLFAQGTAIWVALIFNFTAHHLFTYGGSHAAADAPALAAAAEPVSIHAWARLHPPSHE